VNGALIETGAARDGTGRCRGNADLGDTMKGGDDDFAFLIVDKICKPGKIKPCR
jgi:hypothetical protein